MSYLLSWRKQDVVKILPLKIVCNDKAVEAPHGSWVEVYRTLEVRQTAVRGHLDDIVG